MSKILFAMAAAALVLCAPVLSLAAQKPPHVGSVALVIASPLGDDAAAVAARAGVPEVGPVRSGFGVFVEVTSADSVDRLRTSGALFVVQGEALLALCAR